MSPALASSTPAARTRAAARRGAGRDSTYTIDLVLLTVVDGELGVALTRADAHPTAKAGVRPRERYVLPWEGGAADEPLQAAATRVAEGVLGGAPGWMEQIGAFGDGRRHPASAPLSVGYVALVPAATDADADAGAEFFALSALPPLAPRQRAIVDAAVAHVRGRVGQAPVAFRLLPPSFTLSELQERYELLLGRQLHKASFRRALQGARIVEPTDVWRSEGRGRPAQLFRYATRRKKVAPRGVRFDA